MSFFGLHPGLGTVFLSGGISQEGTLIVQQDVTCGWCA
jgi:hypothetical protein